MGHHEPDESDGAGYGRGRAAKHHGGKRACEPYESGTGTQPHGRLVAQGEYFEGGGHDEGDRDTCDEKGRKGLQRVPVGTAYASDLPKPKRVHHVFHAA